MGLSEYDQTLELLSHYPNAPMSFKTITASGAQKQVVRLAKPGEICERNCINCMQQFTPAALTYHPQELEVREVSDVKARTLARKLAGEVRADRLYLKERLAQYGDSLLNRWKKKSTGERVKILRSAEPSLYKEKWPEARIMFSQEKPELAPPPAEQNKSIPWPPEWFSKRQRMALILPYLNLETLSEDPMKLLSLLHHRTESLPEEWVSFDIEQMKYSWNWGCIMNAHNTNCVIMHGADYGELVAWEQEDCHTWTLIGFPLAKLVLEAQAFLFGFLKSVVDAMVKPGVHQEGCENWIMLTSVGFKAPGQVVNWSAFSNQPFSAPPTFDPYDRLEQARATLAAAQDHLELLQTEPQYLWNELSRRRSDLQSSNHLNKMWWIIAIESVALPMGDVQRLKVIVDQCEYIVQLYEQHKASIRAFAPLPTRYAVALGVLEWICDGDLIDKGTRMKLQIPSSRTFAKHYKPGVDSQGNTGWKVKFDFTPATYQARLYEHDKLLWAVHELAENPRDPARVPKWSVMAKIEGLMSSLKSMDQVDPEVYHRLATMEFLQSMQSAIRLIRPQIRHVEGNSLESMLSPAEKKKFGPRYALDTLTKPSDADKEELARRMKEFMDTPLPKGKRDEQWLKKATMVRQKQADIWSFAREALQRQLVGEGISQQIIDAEIVLMSLDLSSEHLDFVEAQAREIRRKADATGENAVAECTNSVVQTQWGSDDKSRVETSISRPKLKTRGEASASSEEQLPMPADEVLRDEVRKSIPVKAESIRVFDKMFSSRLEYDNRGSLPWNDFVAAMIDAGFSATHTGGSEVTFKPVTPEVAAKGRIVFHKPHPDSRIDSIMLSSMGRRLRKWFDWDVETFVEREKGSA